MCVCVVHLIVVRTGIEPVTSPWKGDGLTPCRTDRFILVLQRYVFYFNLPNLFDTLWTLWESNPNDVVANHSTCRRHQAHLGAGTRNRTEIFWLEVRSNNRYTIPASCDNLWGGLSLLREWGDQSYLYHGCKFITLNYHSQKRRYFFDKNQLKRLDTLYHNLKCLILLSQAWTILRTLPVLTVGFEPTFSTYRYRYGRYKRPLVRQHFSCGWGTRTPVFGLWDRAGNHLQSNPLYIYNIPNNEPIKYKPIITNPTLKLWTIDSIKISFKSFILYTFVVRGWNRTTGTRRFKSLLYLLSYRTIFEVENLCVVVCDYNFCNSSNVTLLYNSFLEGTTQYCW